MRELFDKLINGPFIGVAAAAVVILYIYMITYWIRVIRKHPSTLTFAVLGFPNSGKTVYITTLFDELQQGKSERLRLTPYGTDTVEEVTKNLNSLARGIWLPRTQKGNVFFFRAIVSVRDSLASRIKLEIADFAGEDIAELQPSSDRWLHKSDYFKYVVYSDAIFLALDGAMFTSEEIHRVDETVNAFVAAIQIIADTRGYAGNEKMNVPIALLVMKSDLFDEQNRADILRRLERLVSVSEGRCRYFRTFFVSSTGPVDDEKPPLNRRPQSVISPLEWAVGTLTKTSVFNQLLVRLVPLKLTRERDRERDRWDSSKNSRR